MSFILVSLILPLEQASCHCQGQTLFCQDSRHSYSELRSAHLNSHHTSCSFPFLFPMFIHYSLPWFAHWSCIQFVLCAGTKKNKTYTHATRIYWDCSLSFGFLFLSGFLSLSAHGTQTDFLVDASREQIPLKRCLIIIFCVHFCSVNIRKHVFQIYLQDLISC